MQTGEAVEIEGVAALVVITPEGFWEAGGAGRGALHLCPYAT